MAFHAVVPRIDCPHVATHFKPETIPTSLKVRGALCDSCSDSSENWLCVSCFKIGCSRYVNRHALDHFSTSGHSIAISFSDLSCWCFSCESYIKNSIFDPLLQQLHNAKFGDGTEEEPSEPSEDKDSEEAKNEEGEEQKGEDDDEEMDMNLLQKLMLLLGRGQGGLGPSEPQKFECPLKDLSLEGVAQFIKEGKCKNIIIMSGAGISVAAGIPDFRTPGTGLYDNLQKYKLPHPTAVFELDFFRENPNPFYLLAKELYPGNFKPTPAHYFVELLRRKGVLLRNFTQNIDTLERVAGVDGEVLVEAHGSFAASHCIECKAEASNEYVKECVFSEKVPRCEKCNGLVKPDIVFFGENLPQRFFMKMAEDFPKCDLLIVIGTSLQVQPFASLISKVPPTTPRLLINREVVGESHPQLELLGISQGGFRFDGPTNYRDVKHIGDCQDGVLKLVDLIGWKDEFMNLMNKK